MKNLNQAYGALRRKNWKQYQLLAGCIFFSVLLITALAVMMQSNTVQTILPAGGDSRKQMDAIFVLAIVGCGVFTSYASSLFFRSKSRECGILMAMGTSKKRISGLLLGDVAVVSTLATLAGVLLAAPLAFVLWQLFRLLVVDTAEMAFSIGAAGFLWGIVFSVFCIALLFFMAWRFVRRSDIIDVVNEQRKSEPIRDVKAWYGPVGLLLMVLGGAGGYFIGPFFVYVLHRAAPFWANGVFLLVFVGLYMLLVYLVVRGGGRRNYYKNIITRSIMRFQGRQTVRNMCVITVLVAGAYFALFYIPATVAGSLYGFSQYEKDFSFHYRADEDMPGKAEIEQMAREEGVPQLLNYDESEVLTLATDGFSRDYTEDGRISEDYYEMIGEKSFLSESSYNRLTGQSVDIQPGHYGLVRMEGDRDNIYSYEKEMSLFTNPVTKQTVQTAFQEVVLYPQLRGYVLLDDSDYTQIGQGLTPDWKEQYVQFDVENEGESYPFAKRLKNELIDRSSQNAAVYENYDRIEKMRVNALGEEYRGDVEPDLQVDFSQRDSSDFNIYWKYIPKIRILDSNDLLTNLAVYIMIFAFIAVICFASVLVIAYTRSMTIALNNRQVFEDLRRLGANRAYLYKSVRGQISKVFFAPCLIGTLGMLGLFTLILFGNSGALETGEWIGLALDLGFILFISLGIWGVYRLTLHKVCRQLAL